jgi:PAS domain S-box-containing protein
MDYLSTVWFFFLTLAGITCVAPARLRQHFGWGYLGLGLISAALLRLWPLIWCGEPPMESISQIPLFLTIAGAGFFLFAARKFSRNAIPLPVVILPLVAGAALCWSLPSYATVHMARWLIWSPSLLVLSYSILMLSSDLAGDRKLGKRLVSLGIFALALLHPMSEVYCAVTKASAEYGNIILIRNHLAGALLMTLSCTLLVMGTWICFRQREVGELTLDRAARRRGNILLLLLLVVLTGGWLWTNFSSTATDQQRRGAVEGQADLAAAACSNSEFIDLVSGKASDVSLPAYLKLKERLAQITRNGERFRFAYLMTLKDHQIIFLADGEPRGSKDESLPGDIYHEAKKDLYDAFYSGKAAVSGPYTDEWGVWISAFSPVHGNEKNGFPIFIGIDKSAAKWFSSLDRSRQENMLEMLEMALFITGLFVINYLNGESRIRQAASEERLRLSLHGANLISWEMDLKKQAITIDNRHGNASLSLPPHLSAHEFLTLVHPDDWAHVKQAFTKFFKKTPQAIETEFRLRQPDGTFIWVISRGQVTDSQAEQGELRAAGMILDISTRKETELALEKHRKEAARLALVAENTSSAVIITNAEGLLEWTNTGFTEITGYTLEEIKGKKPGHLLQGKETEATAVARIKSALSNGQGFHETLLNYHKDGSPYWVDIECQPLLDGQGRLSGYMAIETDVTRRMNAEKALAQQRLRLQQINKTLLELGDTFEENIADLIKLAAQIFSAERIIYGRIQNSHFKILGHYGLPQEHPLSIPASGSLYTRVIVGENQFIQVWNPAQQGSKDPSLVDFDQLIGMSVDSGISGNVGSFSLLYKSPFLLTEDLKECLVIISQAIGREELFELNRNKLDALSALEATERNRFATLLQNIDDAVLVEDPNGLITYINSSFEKMFLVSYLMVRDVAHKVVLKKTASYFLNNDEFLDSAFELFADVKPKLNEVFQTQDGRYLARDFFPIISNGVRYGSMWRYRDITQQRKHQHLLETIGDVGQLVLNTPLNSPNSWSALVTLLGKKTGIDRACFSRYRFAPDGSFQEAQIFVEWNQQLGHAFYRDADEIADHTFTSQEQPAYWLEHFLNGRSVFESDPDITAPRLRKLGTLSFLSIPLTVEGQLWGTMSFHHIKSNHEWQDGEITLLETMASLISSRLDIQQSEKALVRARDAANEASRAKSTFLATMSHEIRTPLNAVIGVSSLLLESNLEPQQRDYAATVVSSGEILLELINDILDYSKIETGKIDIESLPFCLADVIVEPLEILARPAAEKKIDLSYSMDPALSPVVIGDRLRLKQVLLNLVSNAVKFTERGSVSIGVEAKEGYLVCLHIRDSGIGMSEEVKSKLFLPFMQADSSVTRKYGGTGLGLAISKRLIELMGGTISVSSTPGEGTTFTLELPLPSGEADPKAVPALDASMIGKKVLIVDDNQVNRHFLKDQLSIWGLTSQESENATDALSLLGSENNFDLVLLDYQMPDLDGLTLARKLKELPTAEKIPLILLSSVIERVPSEDAKLFSAALTKPLRISQLMEVISTALGSLAETPKEIASLTPAVKIRVLVAEDNVTNQKVITMMLSRLDIVPMVVENGQRALEEVKNNPFDLVLLDIQMPVMDGLETSRRMREYYGKGIRPEIIALTANAFKEDREACFEAGMDGYLVKPITLERLRGVVEGVRTTLLTDSSI